MAAALPQLDLGRARDMAGRTWEIWLRRALFTLLCLVPVLALFNVFGQQPATATYHGDGASLRVFAPEKLRGGLLYEARFTLTAERNLKSAALVLGDGWAKGITINTIEPSPQSETSVNGRLSFQIGSMPAGSSYVLHLEFQVNPTTVGPRDQTIAVYDGDEQLLTADHHLMVWP